MKSSKNPQVPPKPLRIGAVARQLGISESTIRAWERVGVKQSGPNEPGVHRTYSAEDIRMLKRATYLRRVLRLNIPAILNQLRTEGYLLDGAGSDVPSRNAQASIGSRLRSLRLQRKEALSEVAKAAGISVGFLSNLERSQTGVSVGIMHRLARHYGRNVLDFFSHHDSPGPLVRPAERRVLSDGDGVRMDLLAWGKIVMEPHLFHVEPGSGSDGVYSHEGEEFLYMIAGTLLIEVGGKEFKLRPGDSFYFESKTTHRWSNPGKRKALVLWINTPPTF